MNNTNKFISIYTIINFTVYFVMMFIVAMCIGNSNFKGNIWMIIPEIVGVMVLGIWGLVLSSITNSKEFYDTYDILKQKLEETNAEWNKANKFIKIIGKHEAIRLWNEEKEKVKGE